LLNVPVGTEIVVDMGEGQLAVAVVRRSTDADLGVEFETPLVSDGAGGLCTRHRVSPYAVQAAAKSVVPFTSGAAGASPEGGHGGAAAGSRKSLYNTAGSTNGRARWSQLPYSSAISIKPKLTTRAY
jgi:hypothetical protein